MNVSVRILLICVNFFFRLTKLARRRRQKSRARPSGNIKNVFVWLLALAIGFSSATPSETSQSTKMSTSSESPLSNLVSYFTSFNYYFDIRKSNFALADYY